MRNYGNGLLVAVLVLILVGRSTPVAQAETNDTSQDAIIPATSLKTLPFPQSITVSSGSVILPTKVYFQFNDHKLQSLIPILNTEYQLFTGGRVVTRSDSTKSSGQLSLALDPALDQQAYRLVIDSNVQVTGGSYQAVAMAGSTLWQLLERQTDGQFAVPRVTISDSPALPFRALLIDVARKWHDVSTLEQLIELTRWYKINYVQLHLTDNELFTFPTTAFPELTSPDKHYTKAELRGLVEYARDRGVTLIPEIDVPGHARLMIERRRDKFGFATELKDGKQRPLSTINIGRTAAYTALDKLIGELAQVFSTSPYIHMGGDEANLEPLLADAEVRRYMSAHNLTNLDELYRHFIVRMNEIVKRHGKQMIVWEGFKKAGQVEIPRDVIVMAFETAYQLPQDLLAGGYKVINTSWQPLYVVNERNWDPAYIYTTWNPYRWENPFPQHPSFKPIQLEPNPQVLGAMMCAWEQPPEVELSSLRQRLAAFSERVWHGGLQPERSVSWFENAFVHTDAGLSALLTPAK